jgi:hypothetical protein
MKGASNTISASTKYCKILIWSLAERIWRIV